MEAIEDDMFESGLKAEPFVRLSKLPALENYPGDIAQTYPGDIALPSLGTLHLLPLY